MSIYNDDRSDLNCYKFYSGVLQWAIKLQEFLSSFYIYKFAEYRIQFETEL